jgi:hypothetical protein
MTQPLNVPRYQQPDPDLHRISDGELRRRHATATSWQRRHYEDELQRREGRRTGRRTWVVIGVSILALVVSALALTVTVAVNFDALRTFMERLVD